LKYLANNCRNAEYNPKRFPSVLLNIRDPKATAKIFHTGKIVVLGTKCEEDSKTVCRMIAKIIQKIIEKQHNTLKLTDFKFRMLLDMLQ